MANSGIPAQTSIGAVHLTVSNLQRSLNFYRQTTGLALLGQAGNQVTLGSDLEPLVILSENPNAKRPSRTTGLYHFAILVPGRAELAYALMRLSRTHASVQGFADHGVSEAVYLTDPDGNGIEIYWDRPPAAWPYDSHGELNMTTDPLDVEAVLAEVQPAPVPPEYISPHTRIGHIHLHVSDLEIARRFYVNTLGFERTQTYTGSALFVSAGGYHHHIGLNTWAGRGAPPPPPDSTGLCWFQIRLPSQSDLEQVQKRILSHGGQIQEHAQGLLTHDPSQNGVLLTA
ncbi:MAG: VOC family protein [Chloroflexi bacterium]|nr:VOC family protein [Anaerolineaceae bacterium]NMB89650.1 VOC family protein [Chloroflexota bacterium]